VRLLCRLSSVRLWLTVVLISAAFVCALWATAPGGGGPVYGPGRPTERDCQKASDACSHACINKYGNLQDWVGPCLYQCGVAYADCIIVVHQASVGAGGAIGPIQPPNATGPNSTPTPPRKYPIKGPPHKFGPNPTPSPTPWTGFPKPTPPPIGSPTPTPSATPRRHPIKGPPHRLGPSPTPSPKPILLAKPKPTPSPKPTPKKSSHSNSHH
jgi:hypothetical protein